MLPKIIPSTSHNHDACAAKALSQASNAASANGIRLTPLRHYVLEMLLASHRPLGAYDVLAALAREDSPARPSPPTVYRALEFWQDQGFIHRIDSLNAYASCHAGHRHAGSQYMICDDCGRVEEVHLCDLPAPFRQRLGAAGFALARWSAELHGTCRACTV